MPIELDDSRKRLVATTISSMALIPLLLEAFPFAYAQVSYEPPETLNDDVSVYQREYGLDSVAYSIRMLSFTLSENARYAGGPDTIYVPEPLPSEPELVAQPVAEPKPSEPQPQLEHSNDIKTEDEKKEEKPVPKVISSTTTFVEGFIEPVEDPGAYDPDYEFKPTTPVTTDYSWVTGHTFDNMSKSEKATLIGEMAREDYKQTGILASVTAAQFICESGVMSGGSKLADEYNNCFGIKASADGFNWRGSTWRGHTVDMKTKEEYEVGNPVEITATFRAYDNVWDSVRDHSAYLTWMTRNNGAELRYRGIVGCTDPAEAIHIIKSGGYATSSSYEATLMKIIDTYNLRQYDVL